MFTTFVMVDWSGSSRPTTGKDSIWTAVLDTAPDRFELVNHSTRKTAIDHLGEVIGSRPDSAIFVGVDFPLGYPTGFAAAISAGGTWRDVWDELHATVIDGPTNTNNRFAVAAALNDRLSDGAGPFWGCPSSHQTAQLRAVKAHDFPFVTKAGRLDEFRLTERRLREMAKRPMSVWQTFYPGSVGGQALTGIPAICRLIAEPDIRDRAIIWPMQSLAADFDDLADPVVIAEVWPSLFDLDLSIHPVRDAAQVIGVCRHLAALDGGGSLAALLDPEAFPLASRAIVAEEGWILGCPPYSEVRTD